MSHAEAEYRSSRHPACVDDEADFKAAGVWARREITMIRRMSVDMHLTAFRTYLSAAIRSMSAIVPGILEANGTALPSALLRLRPDASWPSCAGRAVPRETRSRVPAIAVAFGSKRPVKLAMNEAYPLRAADALISDGALCDWVEMVVEGRLLEIRVRTSGFDLRTKGEMAELRLPLALPDVVVAAGAGRALDDLVDVGVLRGRGFSVAGISVGAGETQLLFHVGRLPVEMPWRP